jgi:hypothetical protein
VQFRWIIDQGIEVHRITGGTTNAHLNAIATSQFNAANQIIKMRGLMRATWQLPG